MTGRRAFSECSGRTSLGWLGERVGEENTELSCVDDLVKESDHKGRKGNQMVAGGGTGGRPPGEGEGEVRVQGEAESRRVEKAQSPHSTRSISVVMHTTSTDPVLLVLLCLCKFRSLS